jgi:hypothetical protein
MPWGVLQALTEDGSNTYDIDPGDTPFNVTPARFYVAFTRNFYASMYEAMADSVACSECSEALSFVMCVPRVLEGSLHRRVYLTVQNCIQYGRSQGSWHVTVK